MISVFILVGVRLYREGLEQCLTSTVSMSVVGNAAAPAEALDQIAALCPDVVLLDLGLTASLCAAREIRLVRPATKIIALAVTGSGAEVIDCAEAGVFSYVTRDSTLADLVDTIERAARGETVCPPEVTARLFERLAAVAAGGPRASLVEAALTARERDIVRLIEQGLSNKEIARTLSIALPTVKNHVHNVLRKLQVERRLDVSGHLARPVFVAARHRP